MKLYTLRYTNGEYATIQRMSILNREYFSYHIKEAYQVLSNQDDNTNLRNLYCQNDEFKYHCDECFKLNSLNPKLLSDDQFIALLFGNKEYPQGYLNHINFNLSEMLDNTRPAKSQTYGSILGNLWKSLNDLNLALEVCETIPIDVLEDMFYELQPQEKKFINQAKEAMKKYTERQN